MLHQVRFLLSAMSQVISTLYQIKDLLSTTSQKISIVHQTRALVSYSKTKDLHPPPGKGPG